MSKAVKTTLAVAAAGVAAIASTAMTPASVSAWGDNGKTLRPSYTIEEINRMALDGTWGNKIVFNSISNSVIGDEKNFVGAREDTGINAGKYNLWEGNDITVEDGKDYLIRLYVHNNNPNGYGGVSHNTRVAFNIPTVSSKEIQVNGYIFSDNATPSEYWDYVNFHSVDGTPFHLEYDFGSATIENNGYASKENGGPKPLGDEIVTKAASENGVAIGYAQAGDGEIPGCYQFDNFVGIRVKVVYDTDYRVDQRVRAEGTTDWKYTVENAKVGDRIQFRIKYTNTGDRDQHSVMLRSVLPKALRYVPGTTYLTNTIYPNGTKIDQDTIVTTGINIGAYAAKANGYVDFIAEVVDNGLQAGDNTLVGWAQATVGQKILQDYSAVLVNIEGKTNDPEKPNTLPNTGPEAVAGGVIAAGSVVTAAGYYVASRRSLRK